MGNTAFILTDSKVEKVDWLELASDSSNLLISTALAEICNHVGWTSPLDLEKARVESIGLNLSTDHSDLCDIYLSLKTRKVSAHSIANIVKCFVFNDYGYYNIDTSNDFKMREFILRRVSEEFDRRLTAIVHDNACFELADIPLVRKIDADTMTLSQQFMISMAVSISLNGVLSQPQEQQTIALGLISSSIVQLLALSCEPRSESSR